MTFTAYGDTTDLPTLPPRHPNRQSPQKHETTVTKHKIRDKNTDSNCVFCVSSPATFMFSSSKHKVKHEKHVFHKKHAPTFVFSHSNPTSDFQSQNQIPLMTSVFGTFHYSGSQKSKTQTETRNL